MDREFLNYSLHEEGGCAAGAFGAGVNMALKELNLHKFFAKKIGTSAGAANQLAMLFNFSNDDFKKMWEKTTESTFYMPSNPFGDRLHLDDIIEPFRKIIQKTRPNKEDDTLFPTYCVDTESIVWHSASEYLMSNPEELVNAFKASMSLPGFTKGVRLNSLLHIDPGIAYESVPLHNIDSKKIIIRTVPKKRSKGWLSKMWEAKYWFSLENHVPMQYFEDVRLNAREMVRVEEEITNQENNNLAIVIRPEYELDRIDFSYKSIIDSIEHGFEQGYKSKQQIEEFLGI